MPEPLLMDRRFKCSNCAFEGQKRTYCSVPIYSRCKMCKQWGTMAPCGPEPQNKVPSCPDDNQWRIIGVQPVEGHERCDHCGHLIRTPVTA